MKASTAFIVLGVVVATGGYVIGRYCKSTNEDKKQNSNERYDDIQKNVHNQNTDEESNRFQKGNGDETLSDVVDELRSEQSDIKDNIAQRHKTSAKIMKESMEHIMQEKSEKKCSQNVEDLEEIDDTLDKLLDE